MFQLVMRERIATSEAKAKEIRSSVEKLITLAKGGTLASRRILASRLPDEAAAKLVKVVAPRFQNRRGGYTRIVKLAPRKSDSSRRAIIQLIP